MPSGKALGVLALSVALAWLLASLPLPMLLSGLASFLLGLFGFGLLPLLIILASSPWLLRSKRVRHLLGRWNWALGVLLLGLILFGLLAMFRPEGIALGETSLEEATAGGSLGRAMLGSANLLGVLRLFLLLLLAGALLSPRSARSLALRARTSCLELYHRHPPRRLRARLEGLLKSRPRLPQPPSEALPQVEKVAESIPHTAVSTPASEPPGEEPVPIERPPTPGRRSWELPSIHLLDRAQETEFSLADNQKRAELIEKTLGDYGVSAKVVQVNQGPTVTQFGVEPGWEVKTRRVKERDTTGRIKLDRDGMPKEREEEVSRTRVKVSQITTLANDLALALAAPSIRIEAPVPGKPVVGIEVPNTSTSLVALRSVIESTPFQRLKARSKLALALGKSVEGEAVVGDLARMPHLLIAGATGSGKSVCINSIICCLLMHATPEEVRFLMIDPKRVELVAFAEVPHLLSPPVTDIDRVVGALKWVAREMEGRYRRLAAASARNIEAYNRDPPGGKPMPYIVLIIDELADLMMTSPFEVERTICRLAQLARATGIHLVIATQRPSVDVVTGLIKANFPTRIAFAVTSNVDSRTILDTAGAEHLLGRGDMLYMPTDAAKPRRLQGAFVSDQEMERLVSFWRDARWGEMRPPLFTEEIAQSSSWGESEEEDNPLFERAKQLAAEHSYVSISFLQRRLGIGYNRAARLMEMLEEKGIVGPAEGSRSRPVLIHSSEE